MANLSIVESDQMADICTHNEELLFKEGNSGIVFFGDLEVPMHEIDEAIKKLEQLSLKRINKTEIDI